jgi:hypothetical protein
MEVIREDNKKIPATHKTVERSGDPANLGGWLADEKTHHNPSTTITIKSSQDTPEGHTTRGLIGVIERLWSVETWQRHCTIDIIEGQRASETTLRTDTTCVENLAERSHAAKMTPHACVPLAGVEGHHKAETHPLSTLAWSTPNMPKSFEKDPTLDPSNRQ